MDDKLDKTHWLSHEGLTLIQGWARDGLTDEQIAARMGIARKTLWQWRKDNPELAQCVRSGKEVADYAVESALYKNAIEGNVSAQMFWLKNRKREQWNSQIPIGIDTNVYQVGIDALRTLLTPLPEE